MDELIDYILVQRNAIPKETVDKILKYSIPAEKKDLAIFDIEKSDKDTNAWVVDHENRNTQAVKNFSKEIDVLLIDMYKKLVLDLINPYYGFRIRDLERPQILHYGPGGHYKPHVDAEAQCIMTDGSIEWVKTMNRDLSTLLYLNEDFEGGHLVFPGLGLRINPEPGLFVAFPSTHHFEHGVEPVISGHRYTIVNWMTVEGFDRIDERNQNHHVRIANTKTKKSDEKST